MWIDTISTAKLSWVIAISAGQSMISSVWAAFITADGTDNKGADKLDKIRFEAFKTLTFTHLLAQILDQRLMWCFYHSS